MDVKLIIRDLLAKGMSVEEVRRNLEDLGVENVDDLLAQAAAQVPLAPQTSQKPQAVFQPAAQAGQKPQPLFRQPPQPVRPEPEEVVMPQVEEIPKQTPKPVSTPGIQGIQITNITSEGEKEITVGAAQQEEKPEKLFTPVSKTSLASTDELEEKLDEIISLLKALQEINKKVLDTDREVLLRLKV